MHTTGHGAKLYDYGLKLAALDHGALIARTSTRHIHLGPHIRVVSLITSPGDHAGLWGVADREYTRSGKPNITATGDPGTYQGQHDLWDALGQKWGTWITATLANDQLPQLAVANRDAAARLAWSAKRIITHPSTTETAAAAARYIITAYSRMKAPGQQVFLPMTDALREHYASGADTADETHLGLWLDWPTLPENWDREQTALDENFEAEGTRFGKAVDRMHAAQGNMRSTRAARIVPLLTPVLTARHEDITRALGLLRRHPGPTMEAATQRYQDDARAMARYVGNATAPGYKSVPARVATLHEREGYTAYWRTSLWAQDHMEATRAAASGDVLMGEVDDGALVVAGPVRARPGDTFTTAGGPATVESLATSASTTTVTFDVLLTDEDTMLTPTIQKYRPPRWVKPGWVHGSEVPARGPGGTGGRGDLTAWAESLKSPHY